MSATLLTILLALPQAAPDTAVVCPAAFRDALAPWLEHRTGQGHHIVMLSSAGSAKQIRRRIRETAGAGRLRFVVLVGDAEPDAELDPALRARCVPVHRAKAEVNVLWGSEPHIAADNWYADLDDREADPTPELAIGRLTADSPEELSRIVAKILAYERSTDFGPWRRRVNVVAGISRLGPLTDLVIERATGYFLTNGIPAGYRLSMTHGSWTSPYCPDPQQFHDATLRRLNEGSWFWVYIGHGLHWRLDRLRTPAGQYPILNIDDVPKLQCARGAPIALFLACYTGAFDARTDCLAEAMLRQPGGPVAVLANSRVSMPYAMALLATGLMDECFRNRPQTLGEAVLRAKQNMMKEPDPNDHRRAMLDTLAAAVSPTADKLDVERAEHVQLLNLIGDPLLRLRYPQEVKIELPATVVAGEPLIVSGTSPVDGQIVIELAVRRNRLTFIPPDRSQYPRTFEALAQFQQTYHQANDHRLASAETAVQNDRFTARLDVPEKARGTCHVRVFVEGSAGSALGAVSIKITKRKERN